MPTEDVKNRDSEPSPSLLCSGSETCLVFSLWLAVDRMQLFLDCIRKENSQEFSVNADSIARMLASKVDSSLLDAQALKRAAALLDAGYPVEKMLIAAGKPATDGKNGRFETLAKIVPIKDAGGERSVEPIAIELIQTLAPGTVVGRLYAPTKGVDGTDALGKPLAAVSGQAANVEFDGSLALRSAHDDPSSSDLISCKTGFLAESKGRLSVEERLFICGHVNVTHGDIDFPGAVAIRGNVMHRVHVKAAGDILIEGNVFGGSLLSSDGSVTINGFLSGEDSDSRVVAARNARAQMIQDASIEAVGDIEIGKEVRDSKLRSMGRILVPNGHLFGGEALSQYGLEVEHLGSSGGGKTLIRMITQVQSSPEYVAISKQITEHERLIDKLRLKLGAIADYTDEQIKNDERELKPLIPYIMAFRQACSSRVELDANLSELRKRERERIVFRVNVLSQLYKGVIIKVGSSTFSPPDALLGPLTIEYHASENQFSVGDLKPLVEPKG